MAKRASTKPAEESVEPSAETSNTVRFETTISWAGDNFSCVPGDVLDLPEDVARAREAAGLGRVVGAE